MEHQTKTNTKKKYLTTICPTWPTSSLWIIHNTLLREWRADDIKKGMGICAAMTFGHDLFVSALPSKLTCFGTLKSFVRRFFFCFYHFLSFSPRTHTLTPSLPPSLPYYNLSYLYIVFIPLRASCVFSSPIKKPHHSPLLDFGLAQIMINKSFCCFLIIPAFFFSTHFKIGRYFKKSGRGVRRRKRCSMFGRGAILSSTQEVRTHLVLFSSIFAAFMLIYVPVRGLARAFASWAETE